jgi:UDP-galactopyranose mutase
MQYDWLIVGAGISGCVFANEMKARGHKILVIEKRDHIGGNVYTETIGGIQVHRYGAHIFHTSDREVWDYVNRYAEFNRFTNAPLAKFENKLYHLPFNMNTFYEMWGVTSPHEAREILDRQRAEVCGEPRNLEEQALSMVGRDIYEKLIKGYTEKQWGRSATELPASIILRLPVRFTFDNNYFNDCWQGIPRGGYTQIIDKLLEGVEVQLDTDFLSERNALSGIADRILFTGTIDSYFHSCFGPLEYRSLRFDTADYPQPNFQGNAVINFTARDVPYSRVIEHKHFEYDSNEVQALPHTVVTYEYPLQWERSMEPYYPVNDVRNRTLLNRYQQLAKKERNVTFAGRLGSYQYQDMDDAIRASLDMARALP